MSALAGDTAAASVYVAVPIEDAFEVFTTEIELWWRHGRRFRIAGSRPGCIAFEARLGGRLFETVRLSSGEHTFEVGSVVEWDPPRRFALAWRAANFKPHEKTFVEVTFTPTGDGTTVHVRHSGFASLPEGHPARHGLEGAAFARMIGMWWGALLTSLREHVSLREG
jgi:uncharacterized protein YndB with AHSA1/START domain